MKMPPSVDIRLFDEPRPNNDSSDILINLTQFAPLDVIDKVKAERVLSKIIVSTINAATRLESEAQMKNNVKFLRKGDRILMQYWRHTLENKNYEVKLPQISQSIGLSILMEISNIYDANESLKKGGAPKKEKQEIFMITLMAFFYACYGEEPQATAPKNDEVDSGGSRFFYFYTIIREGIREFISNCADPKITSQQTKVFWVSLNNETIQKRIEKAKKVKVVDKLKYLEVNRLVYMESEMRDATKRLYQQESYYTRYQNAKEFPYYVFESGDIFHEIKKEQLSTEITP